MIRGIVGIKHFYLDKVCKYLRHMFLKVVSYIRVVKLEKEKAFPLALFIQKMLIGKHAGISSIDGIPLWV